MSTPTEFTFKRAEFLGWYRGVAIVLALLVLAMWFFGFGSGGSACNASLKAVAIPTVTLMPLKTDPAAAPVALTKAAAPALAKVYFEVGSATVPADTQQTLAPLVGYLKSNASAKVALSGFHDPLGSVKRNEEIALNRARAVRSALEAQGIGADRMVMKKPAVTEGGAVAQEARRVEVSVVGE